MQHLSNLHKISLASLLALALAACGGSSSDEEVITPPDDGHTHTDIETAGRLVIGESGSSAIHVYDLDSQSVIQTFAADNAPSAIYSSPDQRYALLFQRTQGVVQFVDGGIWQEDHVDHLHDYKEAPALLTTRWSGASPTHYETHDDKAAIFFDGNAQSGVNASVSLLSDSSIATGTPEATLQLASAMHGTAEPRGEYLLTTYIPTDGSSSLPTHVELYHQHGDHYHLEKKFEPECPGLHGSFSNKDYIAFGCTDGVLVVHQDGSNFTASKIANPAGIGSGVRIGTIIGHEDLTSFVGIASPGHLFNIDPVAGTISRITWEDGRTRRAHTLDAEGKNLLVLDDQGKLHILDTQNWSKRATVDAVGNMPSAAPFPALVASHASDTAFLADVNGKQISVIDLDSASIKVKYPLNFTPSALTWLGLAADEHAGHSH